MTRAATDRTPALQLVREMIRIRQQLEPMLKKKGWNLWRKHRDKKLEQLNLAWGSHSQVLIKRYKWLMNEVHTRVPAGRGQNVGRDEYFRAWWRLVGNDLAGLESAEEFSPRLWWAVAAAAGLDESAPAFSAVAGLKPKFMLRQFVDEMTDAQASVSLKILAYSPLTASADFASATALELAEIVYQACLSLHDAVKRFGPSLPLMTGGAIDLSGLNDETAVARQYSAWLFQS